MKITENKLTNIIEKSVKRGLMEYQLKERIKNIIRESFESMGDFSQLETSDSEESEPKPLKKSESGKADFNDENENEQERRAQVEKFFNQDGVDIAPYAYQLYHVEKREGDDTNEMKNARSKFMKCLNHEPNEAGYPYSFSSDETNKLQSMIFSVFCPYTIPFAIAQLAMPRYCTNVDVVITDFTTGKQDLHSSNNYYSTMSESYLNADVYDELYKYVKGR